MNLLRKRIYRFVIISCVLVSTPLSLRTLFAQQPAFPTAEGSGRLATGGRWGTVYEVTNLNNSGAGSIVDAVSAGNRTIVFRVSGTIELGDVLLKPKSNTTIAGQTAPGDGICIKGRIVIEGVTDVVIRYIRVRVDAGAANSSGDAIDIVTGYNIMIDHVTASYARDEGISCQPGSRNITVQWCIISEALTFENHSYGSLIRGETGFQKTYHHNLYAHNNGRNPRPGNYTINTIDPEGLHFDFRNNVVYNWKGSTPGYNDDASPISRYNFIGNVYIPGLESTVSNRIFRESANNCYGYFSDNSYNGVVPADPWSVVYFNNFTADQINTYKARSYLVPMEPVTTTSPAQAKIDVLAYAGANIPKRDTIDRRIVQDVLNGTGHSIDLTVHQPEGAWPVLYSAPAPLDTDHDGMPDDWEIAHGLNVNNPYDRLNIAPSGYTMLEEYLNTITGEIVTASTSVGINSGWNLVSVPRVQTDYNVTEVFPDAFGGVVYAFVPGSGYAPVSTLELGMGYWLFYQNPATVTISGSVPGSIIFDAAAGWNIIGSSDMTVEVSSLVLSGGAVIMGDVGYIFVPGSGYSPVTAINPGEGAWIYVTADCEITIP